MWFFLILNCIRPMFLLKTWEEKITWTLDYPLLASACSKLVFFFKHLLFFFLFELLFPGDDHRDLCRSSCSLCWLIVSALDIWTCWMLFILMAKLFHSYILNDIDITPMNTENGIRLPGELHLPGCWKSWVEYWVDCPENWICAGGR